MISLCNVFKNNSRLHIDITDNACYHVNSFSDITMKRGENMANIMTVRAPDELQRILTEHAKKMGQPRNALILQILWDWVEQQTS